jgi:hypothetical protein
MKNKLINKIKSLLNNYLAITIDINLSTYNYEKITKINFQMVMKTVFLYDEDYHLEIISQKDFYSLLKTLSLMDLFYIKILLQNEYNND